VLNCASTATDCYLHIQLTDEAPEPIKSEKVIGVDFGRREIVTSTGDKWDENR